MKEVVSFDVYGPDREELHRQARRRLDKFYGELPPDFQYTYDMFITSHTTTLDGDDEVITHTWEGSVTARLVKIDHGVKINIEREGPMWPK